MKLVSISIVDHMLVASPEEPAEGPKKKQEKPVRCEEGDTCDA